MKRMLVWGAILLLFPLLMRAQQQEHPSLVQYLLNDIKLTVPSPRDSGELILDQALKLAMENNPVLHVGYLEIKAREAAVKQATLWPNPEVELEGENFGGSGALSGTRALETTISIAQRFEIAGKRQKRARVARLDQELSKLEYYSRVLDLYQQVTDAFTTALAAQEAVKIHDEMLSLAREFQRRMERQVQAGRISMAMLARAQVETARARLTLTHSASLLHNALRSLSATWGAQRFPYGRVRGALDTLSALPALNQLLTAFRGNPHVRRWRTEKARRNALLHLTSARAIPDPSLRLGWRHYGENGDQALLAGLSFPLPLFNRNQGALQEAILRLKQTEFKQQQEQIALQIQLKNAFRALTVLHNSLRVLKRQVIPKAQEAFATIDRGFRQGKFGFLDVLDAQRTLFAVRLDYVQQWRQYRQTQALIERLVAQRLREIR